MACILLLVVVIRHAATDSGDGCTAEVVEATRHITQSLRTAMDTSAQLQHVLTATLRENAELRLALNESQRRVSRLMSDPLMRTLPPAQVQALGRSIPITFCPSICDLPSAAGGCGTCSKGRAISGRGGSSRCGLRRASGSVRQAPSGSKYAGGLACLCC